MCSAEFRSYFEHVASLRFDERPDYDYLKRLFRELFFRRGFSYDNMFDWEVLSQRGSLEEEARVGVDADAGGVALGDDDDDIGAEDVKASVSGKGMGASSRGQSAGQLARSGSGGTGPTGQRW